MTRPTAILCPACRRLVNADEPVCPYCGSRRPGLRWAYTLRSLGHLRAENLFPYVLYTNAALFVLSLLLGGVRGLSPNPLALLSPSQGALFLLGATGTVPIDQAGRWWTLLSANYLHGSILHIFFNMAALNQLGPLTLREYGLPRTVTIYTLGGVGGFLVSYWAGIPFTIGASAALCALLGALLYYGKTRGGVYGQLLFRQTWGWAVGILLFGLLVPGINNWGHGGGMAAGMLLGAALGYPERRREQPYHRLLALLCVAATLLCLGWAVAAALFVRLLG